MFATSKVASLAISAAILTAGASLATTVLGQRFLCVYIDSIDAMVFLHYEKKTKIKLYVIFWIKRSEKKNSIKLALSCFNRFNFMEIKLKSLHLY